MTFKILKFAAFVLAVSLPLTAQEKAPAKTELRFLAFSAEVQQKEVFAHDPAAPDVTAPVKVEIKNYLNHQFSTLALLSRKIVFTTKAERASIGHPEEVIGEVSLPNGVNSAILLFLPGKAGSAGSNKIMVVNDSKKAFPAGSFHITNLSPLEVRLMLEQKQFNFKPGQTVLIEDPPVREGEMSGMRTFAFKNNAWVPVSTGLWPHPGDARGLMVLFQNPSTGNIQLRSFDDVPPRAPQAPAATAAAN